MHNHDLPGHFVDAGGDLTLDLNSRRVILIAYEETLKQRFTLSFSGCQQFTLKYHSYADDVDVDVDNITDGISELESEIPNTRCFEIDFCDAYMQIVCNELKVEDSGIEPV